MKKVAKAVVQAEKKVEKKKSRGVGAMIGTAAGSLFGHPAIGAALGSAAEGLISHLFGSGDYVEAPFDVSNNTLTGDINVMSQQLPAFSGGGLVTRIQHREFIADYGMSASFSLTQLLVTPINDFCFPWLSGIAQNFQKFKFKGLVFELRSTSANAVSSTVAGMGSGFMMTNYDPSALAPLSKIDMLNAYFSSSAKPSESFYHPVECDPTSIPASPLFIYNNSATEPDLHWYAMCTVNVGTQGAVASYGGAWELWVSYDVELYEPIVPRALVPVESKKFTKHGDVPIKWTIDVLREALPKVPESEYSDTPESLVHVKLPAGQPSLSRSSCRVY